MPRFTHVRAWSERWECGEMTATGTPGNQPAGPPPGGSESRRERRLRRRSDRTRHKTETREAQTQAKRDRQQRKVLRAGAQAETSRGRAAKSGYFAMRRASRDERRYRKLERRYIDSDARLSARNERVRAHAFRADSRRAKHQQARGERQASVEARHQERGQRRGKVLSSPVPAAAAPPAPASLDRATVATDAAGAALVAGAASTVAERPREERDIRAAAEQQAMDRLRDAERRESDARIELEKRRYDADAERRISEVERLRRDAESRLQRGPESVQTGAGAVSPTPPSELGYDALLSEFALAERQAERDRVRDDSTRRELEAAEVHLREEQERAMQALDAAGRRLQAVGDRAVEAEARAERAERLAELKTKEVDRAQQLREMLERVSDAERRAFDAEARAEGAVKAISAMQVPLQAPETQGGSSSPALGHREPKQDEEQHRGDGWFTKAAAGRTVSLSSATYEELRSLGLSVAETGRLLAERERMGGFRALEDVAAIRGLPRSLIDELGNKVSL